MDAWERYDEWRIFRYDHNRFRAHRFNKLRSATREQLESKLTFHAHAIEKGLSHTDIRYGFGKEALRSLAEGIDMYKRRGYDSTRKPYLNAMSTLKAYVDLHTAAGQDVTYVRDEFGSMFKDISDCNSDLGGAVPVTSKEKRNNKQKNFKDLFVGRSSIREYADSDVDLRRIENAIQLATKSPSICNRQAARVHVLDDKSQIKEALRVQGGLNGYPTPPVLLVITTDNAGFLHRQERNQVYVDGGIFAMALLLALEYEGVAACSLNTMFSIRQDKAARRLLNIPPSENIIMFISAGNFKPHVRVPKSFRFSAAEIVH